MADARLHQVNLWYRKSPDLTSTLDAGFDAEGNLHVDGQDLGGSVERFFGDSEYEYFITVRPPQMARLAAALAAALHEPEPAGGALLPFITTSLKKIYSGPEAALHFINSTELREWLKKNEIEAEFFTW